MTLKEELIKAIIEDAFVSGVVDLVHIQGGEARFDIIERAAHNAITDNPSITEVGLLLEKAKLLMMFIDLGFVPETVGSNV